jgi:hypothetical protein
MDVRGYVEDTRGSWDRIAAWWEATVGENANAVVRPGQRVRTTRRLVALRLSGAP